MTSKSIISVTDINRIGMFMAVQCSICKLKLFCILKQRTMSPEYSKKIWMFSVAMSLQMPLLSHHMACHSILSVLKINLCQKGMFSGQLNQYVILSRQFFLALDYFTNISMADEKV